MPFASGTDQVSLYYEVTGTGTPILFIHEFAGDCGSWAPQVRHFSRRHRCIIYNARGYPPSGVPDDPEAYSQQQAVFDAIAILDHLGIERAHVIGLSMGGFCAIHLGLSHPQRALSLVVAGCGYGAEPDRRESFRTESEANARAFETDPAKAASDYALGPSRVQFQNKDLRGWSEFAARLAEHSGDGSARTLRGIQMQRPSLYGLRDELASMKLPTLIVTGDEDEGCLDVDLMLKRTIASSALAVLPRTGHACNLEEPVLFNQLLRDFIATVEGGRWTDRDPRSLSRSLTVPVK